MSSSAAAMPTVEAHWQEDDEAVATVEAPLDAALVARLLAKLQPGVEPKRCIRERLGVELGKRLDLYCSIDDIAMQFGISKKSAFQLAALALGTFACRLYFTQTSVTEHR